MLKISSFDVFDTVLTRCFAEPKDIFDELGKSLAKQKLIACDSARFQLHRIKAEKNARRLALSKEVTLRDIYSQLQNIFAWPDEQVNLVMQLEIELEKKSLRAVPTMSALIQKARFDFRSIWFLSDMYLPSSVISEVLQREGIFQEGDRLVVSAELGISKHEGSMYTRLIQELGKNEYDWEHIGDNQHADYTMPKQFGIKAKIFSAAKLSNREVRLCKIPEGGSGLKSRFAGAMRFARLRATHENPDAPLHLINSSVNIVGPLVFAFVWCILRSAHELQIERLYFVSRDGQVLARVAHALQRTWKFPTEIRYLYGSRQAWHLPGVTNLDNDHLNNWLLVHPYKLTLSKIFKRLGFNLNELHMLKEKFFDSKVDFDAHCSEGILKTLKNEALSKIILNKSYEQRILLSKYLEQERFFDGCKHAIVDIGWHGNLQRSLTQSLNAMGKACKVSGFYFGLFGSKSIKRSQDMYPFYNTISSCPFPSEAASILELFLTGDHGSVVCYRDNNGQAEPVLQSVQNLDALKWGLQYHQRAIVSAAEELAYLFPLNSSDLDIVAKLAIKSFLRFFYEPTREEVEIWRMLPFASNQEDLPFCSLVPMLNLWQATMAFGFPSHRPMGFWPEGAAVLNQSPIAKPYILMKKMKRFLRGDSF